MQVTTMCLTEAEDTSFPNGEIMCDVSSLYHQTLLLVAPGAGGKGLDRGLGLFLT